MGKVPAVAIRRQIVALIPVYLNVFMMGCTSGWIANAIYFFSIGLEVSATPPQCSLLASCSELGRIVFAIPSGVLADKYGRKIVIMCAGFLHFFSWLLLSAHTSLIAIFIARFALGTAMALVNATALISIGEVASPEVRGMLTSIFQTFLVFGAVAPSIISVLFSSYYILSYGITFLSCFCFISMFFIMETPNYLVSISKYDKAIRNLKRIRLGYKESEIDNEFQKLRKYIDDEKTRRRQVNWLMFLKSPAIRKPLMSVISINFFAIAIGGNVISIYVTAIYPRNEFLDRKFYPLITQVILLTIAICTTFYIEKFPRRMIFMVGAGLTATSAVFCAITNYCYFQYQDDFFKWTFLFGNIATSIIIAGSVQPMNSAIKSEVLPQAIKGFGGSLGVIAQATANIVSYQMYDFLTENYGLHYMYLVFAMNAIILCALVYYFLPEGRGKYLADVQMEFKDRRGSLEVLHTKNSIEVK